MKKLCHSRTKKNYTSCKLWNQTITLCDNTKPNNSILWQHVRTWYYDKRILPKIMCPHQDKKVVLERGWWKSCVGSRGIKKLCHSRTTKIVEVVTIKPNNSIVRQHVRTWYYDKRILPKIMCPHPLPYKGALQGRRRKLCRLEGNEKVVSLEDNKNYTSCNY